MRFLSVVLIALLSAPAFGQYYLIECDTQNPTEQYVIDSVFSGNTPYLKAKIYENGTAVNLTSWAMQFCYSYGQYDTNGMVVINGVVSDTNTVSFLGATNVFFKAFDKYYFSIKGTHTAGYVKTFATGRMIQRYDPATATNLTTLMGQLNMNWWTNNVGAQVESNRVAIAILVTGKVDLVTYLAYTAAQSSSNDGFNIRIASNETARTAQVTTNAGFDVRIVAVETGKMALAEQAATNAYFQGLHTAQGNTNTYFQGLSEAQANSNAYFQAFKTAQGNSNTYFQGLHTAQANTNIGLQNQLTVLNTGKTDQATYLAGVAAQASSNADYETRIGIVETGKTDQATYLAGLVTQAATNAGLQDQLAVLSTGKTDEVTYLAHVSAQANSNADYESRIGIMETGKTAQATYLAHVAAQAATNTAFESRIQQGEDAYGWGDHALAGYLSGATNIFESITAGDRNKLGTNIAGLTAATYTGALTSVAYTGLTVLAVGRTYVWGFNKVNAYGTSVLSIAEHTLTRTASGAASNFFTYTGTDSNLVLTLYGDGSSKSDVTNVHVRLVTNGIFNVASDFRVGDGMYLGGERRTTWPLDTNAIWGNITGDIADQTDLTSAIPDVAPIGLLASNALTQADGAALGLVASNALTSADVAPIGLLASNALTQADGAALGLVASNALPAADVAPIGLLASNALTQADGAALGLVASNALTAADVAPIGLLASNALTSAGVAPIGLLASNALTQADGAALGLVASNALTSADVAPIGLLASNALTSAGVAPIGLLASNALTSAGVAPIGLLASNALTQTDGAALGLLATNALPVVGGTMTGPLTNEYGYYGDGSGLTNLMSDPSAWSGYAATQQVVWYGTEIVNDTNYLVISGSSSPEVAGLYHWEEQGEIWAYRSAFGYVAPQEDWETNIVFWYLVSGSSEFRNYSADPTAGGYDAYNNATGTLLAAYGSATNAVAWRAGYDVTTNRWVISRNGANIQEWFYSYPAYDQVYTTIKGGLRVDSSVRVGGGIEVDASIHTPALELNGAYRTTWPSEYSDTAIRADLSAVSNQAAAGSNLAYALSGNLSIVSNQAAAGSNLAYDVSLNLDTVSNWAVAGSNLAFDVAGNLSVVSNLAVAASNLAAAGGADLTSLSNNLSAVSNLAALALPTTGGAVTGNVTLAGGNLTASTLTLTNGPVAGSVWVCTNANGSGELRQLGKMTLRPLGSEVYSGFYATSKWSSTPARDIGNMVASENGITVKRDGTYLATMLFNVSGVTNPAQFMRAHIILSNTRVYDLYGPISSLPNQSTISCGQSICASAYSGQTFGVQYYIYNSSVGQTNGVNLGGHLSVIELP